MFHELRVLFEVEAGIIHGKPDTKEILASISARIFLSILAGFLQWYGYVSDLAFFNDIWSQC